MSAYVIAEAGVNHNGNPELAFELLDAAVDAGADAIKFQTFKASQLVTNQAEMASYQKENTGKEESQLAMLQRLELDPEVFVALAQRAEEKNIDFLSTAFDKPSLDFLVDHVGVTRLKIASGEITNGQFLLEHARTNKPVIISTGMCTLAEVEHAIGVFAFGWRNSNGTPDTAS